MLRPHGRISYQHTDADMEILKTDIDLLIENGADGFVFGALTSDRDIDVARSRQIVKWARGLPVTFHRLFFILNIYLHVVSVFCTFID